MSTRIRRAGTADAEAIAGIYAPFVSERATSFELVPPNRDEMARRILAHREQYPWIVFERGDAVLGYAYASPHHERQAYQWSVNVSVYVDPGAHRAGMGRALYTALFGILRRQRFVNAYGGITLPNDASVGLHKALGFVPIGVYSGVGFKFGRWHDVVWLHLRLAELAAPVGDPLPVDRLFDDPDIAGLLTSCARSVRL